MKTKSTELGAQLSLRWYAEKPFAYKIRESYLQRMLIGLLAGTGLFIALIVFYFLSQSEELVVTEKKKAITIDVTAVPPPPPSEVTKQEEAEEAAGGSDAESSQLASADARSSEQAAVASAVESALAEAVAGGIFGEGGGLPTPTAGASGSGEGLLSSVGAGGGLTGLGGASGLGSGLSGGGDIGFGAGGTGTGLTGPGSGKGLGGGSGKGLGIGGNRKLSGKIKKIDVSAGGRSQDEIQRVIQNNQRAIDDCYASARANGDLKGTMTVQVVINPEGTVINCQVVKSSIANDNLVRCIQAKMRRVTFSKVPGSVAQKVNIPLDFSDQ